MEEILFRYVLIGKNDKKIHYKWYHLKQIETGLSSLFDVENYDIISKDQYTGVTDKVGNKVFDKDKILLNCIVPYEHGGTIWRDVEYIVKYDRQGFFPARLNECKVIGNIHESKEM